MALLVRHAMTESPKTLGPNMSAADAAGLMAQFDVGAIPVAGDQGLIGLVTDRDIVVRVVAKRRDPVGVPLGEIATQVLVTVTPDTQLSDALETMAEHKVRRLPVVKDGDLVGILAMGDAALAASSKRALGEALADVSESSRTADLNEGPDRGTPDRVRRSG
jgi:CBS domain-containing protein